jgi:hypothetical protein
VRILNSLLLVGVTAVRGWTFVVVQGAIVLYGVLGFLAVRFVFAAAALAAAGPNAPAGAFWYKPSFSSPARATGRRWPLRDRWLQ